MFGKKRKERQKQEQAEDTFIETLAEESDAVSETESDLERLRNEPEWIDDETEEGKLTIDVYEEGDSIIVKSTIAGVEPEHVDISIENDMLTIRGERKQESSHKSRDYFFQECYWGSFSRSIILPVEVNIKKIDATIKNGLLTIVLPKLKTTEKKSIKVQDENE